MPKRLLNSSVLKWPDAKTVVKEVHKWAEKVMHHRKDIIGIGIFGSYAHGNWGVGSDLDLVIILEHSDEAFERRASKWDITDLPVPTDLLVYTRYEWEHLDRQKRFTQTLLKETVWVYNKEDEMKKR